MEGGSSWYSAMPSTVEEIYQDFKCRREGIIKALTQDFEELYMKCDPKDESFMGLYGLPDESWKVVSEEEGFPMLPNPVWGINNKRMVMSKKSWKLSVAENSNVWLHAMVIFHSSRIGLGEKEKGLLLTMVGGFQGVEEAVRDDANGGKEIVVVRKDGRKRKSSKALVIGSHFSPYDETDGDEGFCDVDEPHCPICGEKDGDEKWILCDVCEGWLHCRCVNIGSQEADDMEMYICPFCST